MNEAQAVLVVDDEADQAAIVRLVLMGVAPQAAVSVVTDTRSVLDQVLAAPKGALVLVDRLLGGQDGASVIDAVRRTRADLHMVLLSAALSEEDRCRALAAGADAAEEKPGNLAGWRGLLGALLRTTSPTPVLGASYTAPQAPAETAGP